MKTFIALLLVALPAAAQACGMPGGAPWHGGGVHAASALYAVLAVLGYWVLQHSGKETANLVRRTGLALGLALVVIGLLGLLCGVGSHIKRGMARSCCPPEYGTMMPAGEAAGMEGMNPAEPQEKKAK